MMLWSLGVITQESANDIVAFSLMVRETENDLPESRGMSIYKRLRIEETLT